MKECSKRYRKVNKGGKVYCPDGTVHLVDEELKIQIASLNEQYVEQTQ
jgi:hypothetical protein